MVINFKFISSQSKIVLIKILFTKFFTLEMVSIFQCIHQRQKKNLLNCIPSFSKKHIEEINETISLANKFGTTSDLDMYPNMTKRCGTH